eukprot:TRINITY_DN22254_c0_g1_i1.p1 TRINITY_DN22254_c0_g1~~TRINITY_DN22254_c0_g1_i1.p1  ORF type:complete len:382 (-),score=64.93 TRINITY_DN22254_c0_g1_i1:15-1160(-)
MKRLLQLISLVLSAAVLLKALDKELDETVWDRGLVKEKTTYSSILKEHDTYSKSHAAVKNSSFPTLAYITPWNNHGYDVAKTFSRKFTYIAPVWLQFKIGGKNEISITGTHDIDQNWLSKVRGTTEPKPKIVPRYLFDGWSQAQWNALLTTSAAQQEAIDAVLKLSKEHSFDGAVFDMGMRCVRQPNEDLEKIMQNWLRKLTEEMHKQNLVAILVVPPVRSGQPAAFGSKDFISLAPDFDHFQVMTYDYSSQIGPNAPLTWMTQSVLALIPPTVRSDQGMTRKILMGVPFYGYDWNINAGKGDAVVANTYLELLKRYKPKIRWDETHHEHAFDYNGGGFDHTVYYPTLWFVQSRIHLADQLGVGLAIWEIGQVLDYFYDLL